MIVAFHAAYHALLLTYLLIINNPCVIADHIATNNAPTHAPTFPVTLRSCPPLCGEERFPFHGNNTNTIPAKEVGYDNSLPSFNVHVLWSRSLGDGKLYGPSVRSGNGIRITPKEDAMWITNDEGGVHILRMDGKKLTEYNPVAISDDHDVESRSLVSFYEKGNEYWGIYAVVDIIEEVVTSRVVCLNRQAKLRWETILDGEVLGSPQISGKWGLITTNSQLKGCITVLNLDTGKTFTSHTRDAPYGPLTLSATDGYKVGYWMEAWEDGYGIRSNLHKVTTSPENVWFNTVRDIPFSSITAPILRNKDSLWLTGRKAEVRGWNRREFNENPTWKTNLEFSFRNESQPITAQAVASHDGKYLLLPSATSSFFCLNAKSGKAIWKDSSARSLYLTTPLLSPDGEFVYTVQTREGTLSAYHIASGKRLWQFGCRHTTWNINCQNSIEGMAALSSYGDILFYVDIYGRISALRITHPPPTASPTVTFSEAPSALPTLVHSSVPTSIPSVDPTTLPTTYPSSGPTMIPSVNPTFAPTTNPSGMPTAIPSVVPTMVPSISTNPTSIFSYAPSTSMQPTASPLTSPIEIPEAMFSVQSLEKEKHATSRAPLLGLGYYLCWCLLVVILINSCVIF